MNRHPFSADSLVRTIEGPRISVPVALVGKLGANKAIFLAQAAYLTSLKFDGWFNLPVEPIDGAPMPSAESGLFARLGSWQQILGIKRDAIRKLRRELIQEGLLEERRVGTDATRHYRVDINGYLELLASCGQQISHDEQSYCGKTAAGDTEMPQQEMRDSRGSNCAHPVAVYKETNKELTNKETGAGFVFFVDELASRGVDRLYAREWARIRQGKRQPLTADSITLIEREAEEAGLLLADAVRTCAARGWAGFQSEWLRPATSGATADDHGWLEANL